MRTVVKEHVHSEAFASLCRCWSDTGVGTEFSASGGSCSATVEVSEPGTATASASSDGVSCLLVPEDKSCPDKANLDRDFVFGMCWRVCTVMFASAGTA